MPQPVYAVMCEYLALEQAMGGYEAANISADVIDSFYTTFASLLNAHRDEIAFVENATQAWNRAVYAIPFKAGDRVLIHRSEYAANILAMLHLRQSKGIEIDVVPSDATGQIDCQALERMITPQTKVIFLTHVPSQNGLVNPANLVGQIARKHGILYVLDACQSLGQRPVDVKAIGCDILCGTGRKFLRGPRGTGILYVNKQILRTLHPLFVDLRAADWTSSHDYALRPDATRFEGWERFMAGQIALGAAAQYAMDIGLDVINARISALATALRGQLGGIDSVTVRDQGIEQSGIVTFEIEGIDAPDAVRQLGAQKMNVSAAKAEHARLELEARGITSLVRASVHYYNATEEIDRFCTAIQTLK